MYSEQNESLNSSNKKSNLGFWDRMNIEAAMDSKHVSKNDMWWARDADPKEAELNRVLKEACKALNINKNPKLVIYKSDVPEFVCGSDDVVGISTNMVSILSEQQIKAIMLQTLEGNKHKVKHAVVDLLFSGTAACLAIVPIELFVEKKFPNYSLKKLFDVREINNLEEIKKPLITAVAAGLAKLAAYFPINAAVNRHYEKEQDFIAADKVGTENIVGALENLQKREEELAHQGITPKWTKKNMPFVSNNASFVDRITKIKEHDGANHAVKLG